MAVFIDEIGDYFKALSITATRYDGSTFTVQPEYEGPEQQTVDPRSGNPKIVFFSYDVNLNKALLRGKEVNITNIDTDNASVEDTPTPYVVSYQVELVSFWRKDDIALLTAWMQKIPARTGIDVFDPELNDTVRLFCRQVGFQDIEEMSRDATYGRMYRKIFRYEIWTELSSAQAETYKLVKTRTITADLGVS